MRNLIALALVAMILPAQAQAKGLLSYTDKAAKIKVGDQEFRFSVHPKDSFILIQVGAIGSFKAARADPEAIFRTAAEHLTKPLGCTVVLMDPMGAKGAGTWEAQYTCPDGVDLRSAFQAQRKELEKGATIHP